jgi:hypothetical protein
MTTAKKFPRHAIAYALGTARNDYIHTKSQIKRVKVLRSLPAKP